MKKINKYVSFIVSAILAILTITFAVLFYSSSTKLSALETVVEDNQNVQYGGHEVRIISRTISGAKQLDEIYVSKKTHKTAGDLFDDINKKKPLFGYTNDVTFGKFITSVNDHEALYEKGSYWKILSPTYNKKCNFDEFKNIDDFKPFVKEWTINIGIDLLPLVTDTVIIFYETPAGNS